MLKIETSPRDDHQLRVVVELEADALPKFMHQAARKISQEAKIPGFRPGKAPYSVIVKLYGEEVVKKEAIELVVDDVYPKMLDEIKINPGAPGMVEEIVSFDPVTLAFVVPLEPEVTLCDYSEMRREYVEQTVEEEEVERVLRNLQAGYGTAEPVERPVEDQDLVYIRLAAKLTQPAEGEDAEIIKERPMQVAINNKDMDDDSFPYEGFSAILVGLSAGDEKVFTYTYTEDSKYEKLRGREVEFVVNVVSVKKLNLPELDDEFAKGLGEFETFADLKVAIHSQLEARKTSEYDQSYLLAFIDEIVEKSTVLYPPQILEHEMEHILEAFKEDLAHDHRDLETYLKSVNKTQEELVEEEIKPAAIQRLKRSLLVEEIARKEKIDISREELAQEVAQTMSELEASGELNKKEYKSNPRELISNLTMQTATRLLNERVLSRLKDIATGKLEKSESTEEAASEEPAQEEKTE